MKKNKGFKQLQCKVLGETFDKIKNGAKEERVSLGKYLDFTFLSLEATRRNNSPILPLEDAISISDQQFEASQENIKKNIEEFQSDFINVRRKDSTLIKKRIDSIGKPWWKRIFG